MPTLLSPRVCLFPSKECKLLTQPVTLPHTDTGLQSLELQELHRFSFLSNATQVYPLLWSLAGCSSGCKSSVTQEFHCSQRHYHELKSAASNETHFWRILHLLGKCWNVALCPFPINVSQVTLSQIFDNCQKWSYLFRMMKGFWRHCFASLIVCLLNMFWAAAQNWEMQLGLLRRRIGYIISIYPPGLFLFHFC